MKLKYKKENWDDSHMKKTIGCTVKTADGITHSVNVQGDHPSPVSQAMTYVLAKYRKEKGATPIILKAY